MAEDVAHARLGHIEAASTFQAGVAEAIVGGSLVGVGQNRVGLGRLLEGSLRRRVPRIPVGMVFQGQLPIGLANVIGTGFPANIGVTVKLAT